jgi:Protein of unknown function (DUF2505)
MKFSHDMSYDATPEQVAEMLADRDFREQVCEAMDSTRWDVSVDGAGEGMEVVVDQTQKAAGIPSFAKKFVGDKIQIIQRESWSSETAATLEIEIPGKPGHLKGGIRLAVDGKGTVETVSGDLKVKVPVVGGKLEDLVASLLRSALRTEEKVGRAWLSAKHG